MKEGSRYEGIDRAKFLLILCVIMIHSNLNGDLSGSTPRFAANAMCFISQFISGAAVPAFMIISGFLFFTGIKDFTRAIYLRKLRSRALTLVIPYLLWNFIAFLLLLIKVRWLGFDGYKVIDQEGFHPLNFFFGFWDFNSGYPFDFVLWFIRNLIVFVLISPLIYLLARSTLLTGLMIGWLLISGNDFFRATYFLIGSWAALHSSMAIKVRKRNIWLICMILWMVTAAMLFIPHLPDTFANFIITLRNLSATIAVVGIKANRISLAVPDSKATFFIYAFHGLFCTIARKASLSVFPATSSLSILCAYVTTFILLAGVSYIMFLIMRKTLPAFTNVLCGGR